MRIHQFQPQANLPPPPPEEFKGHKEKVFNVAWNPIKFQFVASGSDDGSVIVWNVENEDKIVLNGHTHRVRALVWNYEVSWLLISGSWDQTIRVWNTDQQQCIFTAREHLADVYGLATQQQSPFTLVSSSRDSTLRIWSLQELITPVVAKCLIAQSVEQVNNDKEMRIEGESSQKLLQNVIVQQVKMQEQLVVAQFFEAVLTFFMFQEGQDNFWDLVKAALKIKRGNIENELLLCDELNGALLSKANKLEESTGQLSYDYLNKKSDKLEQAASIYLRVGAYESYCKCMIKLNNWEKALAFAPCVSMDFWEELVQWHAKELDNNWEYQLLAGQDNNAIQTFMGNGLHEDAKIVAAASYQNKFKIQSYDTQQIPPINTDFSKIQRKQITLCGEFAEMHLKQGNPLISANYHLTMRDYQGAITKLLRSNELLYAYALCKLFQSQLLPIVAQKVMRQLSWKGMQGIAMKFCLMQEQKNLKYLGIVISVGIKDKRDINAVYNECGLLEVDQYIKQGEKSLQEKSMQDAVYNFIMG
eukprot:TRINITY_DN11823_c0_g1_i4.p2 TRINITY_DN11823_c0_g1~~TRINITY_DN11823_c0_g1_i4.p2  ORF type:complete len:530 (+),score=73.99 TRINITY_DN11823_c0_g1_i4:818-2407(+)